MAILIILFFITVLVVAVAAKGFVVVEQSDAMVIERLGQYYKTIKAGPHILVPFFDKPKEIDWQFVEEKPDGTATFRHVKRKKINLRETVYDFPKQQVITRDNVSTEIDAMLFFQITNPAKAVYEIENLPDAIEKITQTNLRNVVGEMALDELLASRDVINTKLRMILDEATDKWGVKVNRVELQDISPPAHILDTMEKQMRAERDRRAMVLNAEGVKSAQILESEGYKDAVTNRAEGDKTAKLLSADAEAIARLKIAQAEAEAIKKISAAMLQSNCDPTTYLIAVRYIDALKEMVSGKDNKVVYLPYEATGILGSIGGIKEMFEKLPTRDSQPPSSGHQP